MTVKHPFCPPPRRRYRTYGVVMAGMLVFSPPALAQQVSDAQAPAGHLTLQATGSEVGNWSSNPLMVATGATPLWGTVTSPELVFKDTTPASQISLDTKVNENQFNQSAYSSTDAHLTANITTKNERWTTGVQENTDYDTTRTSELTNYGLNPVISRHTGFSVTPQIAYTPTAVDKLSLTGSAALSQYDKDVFTNYETFYVMPTYTHSFDPLNAAIVSLQAQQYKATNNNKVETDSVGPSIGWQTTLSPRFTANASGGEQASRQYDFGKPTDLWTWHYVFSGGLAFKGIQDLINLTAARAQAPYGNGTEALQTSFAATESHTLNPLVSLNVGANYLSSTYQDVTVGNLKDLTGGNVGLTYHATERLDCTATYQYRYETLTNENKTAQDNTVTVGLAYHPNVWTLLQ